MNNYIIIEICLLFLLGITLYNIFIPVLMKVKFGQSVRVEGPRTHLSKTGTPTMGGILMVICFIINLTVILISYKSIEFNFHLFMAIILPMILFAVLGFLDDFLIVVKKNNAGISSTVKFIIQIIISAISFYYLIEVNKSTIFNFFGVNVDLKFGYGLIIMFLLVSFSNGANLTDGMDGLLCGNAIINFFGFAVLGCITKNYLASVISLSFIILLIVFLFFNLPPAKIFMGNTGSYFLGAAIVLVSILLKVECLIIFFGFVYILELISVIVQVFYFKKTKGKRFFRMSPMHHHFELSGMNNYEVNFLFYLINITFTSLGVLIGINIL